MLTGTYITHNAAYPLSDITIYKITHSFLWSPKRLYNTFFFFFFYLHLLPKTCKHTVICEIIIVGVTL